MAYPTEITIGTGSKMSANYQSNEFQISLTYQLERGDVDLAQLAAEKAAEVENLHGLIRSRMLALRKKTGSDSAPINSATDKVASNGSAPQDTPAEKSSHGDPPITAAQKRVVEKLVERCGLSEEELKKLLTCRFGRSRVSDLTNRQARMLIAELQRRLQRTVTESSQPAPPEGG